MTEEDKKEYEEFLQWKAEKQAKEQKDKIMAESSIVKNENNPLEKEKSTSISNSENVDDDKKNKSCAIIILIVIIAIILLFVIIALANRFNEPTTKSLMNDEVDYTEAVVDTIEPSTEPTKVTWDFTISKDQMTDSNNIWANLESNNYISQDFPYDGYTYCTITIRYMKKYGYDVLIQISKGQINGREYYGTNYITARFDDNSSKKYYFNESADGDSKIVFLRNSSDFIKNCKKAKDIKIDLPLYKGGRPVFTFHVDEPLVWRKE